MKKSLSIIAISLLIGGCTTISKNSATEEVTLKSLLQDMTNREIQAELPNVSYTCKQFSSYSRKAKSPEDGWFSNWDWSNFLRIEKNEGRTEYVMYDHEGPGAIVRFWMTFAKGAHNSYLRFYIDGAKTPVLEGKTLDILSGGKVVGAPLSSSSSELTHLHQRGHNLYLPIPYAKSCKVTIETDTLTGEINENGQVEGSFVYYNINYREYTKDAVVQSFTKNDLKNNSSLFTKVNETLLKPMPEQSLNETTFAKTVKAGKSESVKLSGEKAIKKLSVKIAAKDLNQALRSTVLAVEFDEKETIWVPVGDFFGTGYKISPYKSWYTEVTEDGTMSCSWVMPFKNDAKVSFINLGEQDVKVNATIGTESNNWTDESIYFHASWFEKNRVETVSHRVDDPHRGIGAEDVNFVTLKGKGVYVGDSLTLFNGAHAWWGEGDEKIYIDGEKFPSHFGTGTEDYYGYAWCRPEKFHTPFITQPDGRGNKKPGFSVNSRYRLLDNIPFTKSLKVDMELWHWNKTVINYAPTVFYYATAATESNAIKDIANAKMKVALVRSDIVPPPSPKLTKGFVEGEAMEIISLSSGKAEEQGIGRCSNGSHMWWHDGSIEGEFVLEFKADKAQRGEMTLTYMTARDYGIFDVYLNGKLIESDLDLYNEKIRTRSVNYGVQTVNKGTNQIKVILKGVNKLSKPGKLFGLDMLEIKSN